MDDDQQFCLRWNNHQSTLISVFDTLLENQTLVDCTLAAEGKFLKAHKVVLSACSPYFATLLQEQYDKHPIFILKDVKFQELRAMMDYMYRGEVNISQDQLAALLKAAESLQIKGLSDNRSTGNINPAPKLDGAHQQHRNLNVGANVGIKIGGGYTLEQTKRTRLGPNALDVQEMSGSREGSSSPSRRRKKVRRRSIEASLADIQHDNSNSSLQQQSNVVISAPGISNVNPISAAASVLAAAQLPSGATPGTVVGTSQTVASSSSAAAAAAAANIAPGLVAAATQQMLTNVTKKTESVKGAASSEAMNTDELATGVSVDEQEQQQQTATKVDKHNHKYKATSGKDSTDIVEPKSEYDDDGNEGTVEDLTLDEEDMGIDDLDQNAGTSHVGEGSSQGYAPWQHERSQDDLLMTQQDAQQRDPQDIRQNPPENSNDGKLQSESRIRVRNWLMLADQSLIDKQSTNTSNDVENNQVQVNVPPLHNTIPVTNTKNNSDRGSKKVIATKTVNLPNTSHANVTTSTGQTVRRIGSIGRTTIACITPANESLGAAASVDVVSAAALTAAGVELDEVPVDCMTEVLVKIENTSCCTSEHDIDAGETRSDELNELRLVLPKNNNNNNLISSDANNSVNHTEAEEEPENEDDFNNFSLKISSPMSWAYDAVKVEPDEEEFEQMMCVAAAAAADEDDADNNDNDNDNVNDNDNDDDEDDDDLLTTAAATSKQAAAHNAKVKIKETMILKPTRSRQQQKLLLEQKEHLHHLQLQPNQRSSLQLNLAGIPATISKITNGSGGGATSTAKSSNNESNSQLVKTEYKSSVSEDKRYRILIQNQRMRKESLEHSADMIYNADIEKPWVCRNCNRNYKWKNSLKCHLKNECGQPPRYFCSKLCGYATNVHSNLKRHLNTKCRDRLEDGTYKNATPTTTTTVSNTNFSATTSTNASSNNCSNYTLVMQNQN